MGLFGKKKADKTAKNQTDTAADVGVERSAQPAPTLIQVVGDSKHVTTTRFDSNGREIRQTTISKLTPAELQQYGVSAAATSRSGPESSGAPSSQARPAPPPAPKPAPAPSPAIVAPPTATEISVENRDVSDDSVATIEKTRELVKGFIADIWNRGDIELIRDVCHPSLRFNGHVGMDKVGHDGFARMVTTVREALTDYHCEIHSMVVESNKAFCRLKFTGKHTGVLLGYPPTGRPVAWMGASEFTCKNGKILKVWELGDVKSLEAQLRSVDV